jgi:hypothetical protein
VYVLPSVAGSLKSFAIEPTSSVNAIFLLFKISYKTIFNFQG